jgi:RHS repeat-associated protein
VRIVAADGAVTLQTFDWNGMPLTRTEAAGTPLERTATLEYGLPSWPAFITKITEPSALGTRVTTKTWSGLLSGGNTTLTTSITGRQVAGGSSIALTTSKVYDARHRQIRDDGPREDVVDIAGWGYYPDDDADLNRRGRLYQAYSLGLATFFDDYDLYGTAGVVRDPNDARLVTTTDARGRAIVSTSAAVEGTDERLEYISSRQYDTRDRLIEATNAGENKIRYRYENGTNLLLDTILVDAAGNEHDRRHLTRNVIGDIVMEELQNCASPAPACAAWTTQRTENSIFDGQNRRRQIVHADGTRKLFTYDPMGRIATEQDETHTAPNTLFTYDLLGQLTTVTRTLGTGSVTTGYGYNVDSGLTAVTDPNGNITRFEYDDFRRRTKTISPVTGTTAQQYDPAGNIVTSTSANGASSSMTYDAHNRLVQQVSTLAGAPSETVTWTYDEGELKGESARVRALGAPIFGPPSLTPFHGWRGRLASMNDPSGRTTWTYERRGLVTREERILDGSVYTAAYSYDANGNRASITYPSGHQVDTTFDYADRPVTVTSGATPIVTSASYLPFGPLQQMTLGNGTTQTMAFDSRYQVSANRLTGPSGTIADYAYGHDAAGNVTAIHDLTDPAYNRDFGYDDLQRLVTADSSAALWGHGTYSYDAMGNMLALSLGTSRTASFSYQGTTPLLSSVTENGITRGVTYDAAGNELTVGSMSFVYSARNKLRGAGGFTYLYDGRGLRTTTSSGHRTLRSGSQLLVTDDTDLAWFGNRPVAQIDAAGTVHWTHTDALATPFLQTDAAATPVWRAEYEPFGSVFRARTGTALDQPLRFPGQSVDATTGESADNVNRWYRAGWGRYTSADPIGLRGGLNLFAYAKGNPERWTDPTGLKVFECCRDLEVNAIIDGVTRLLGLQHCFIMTDSIEAGMGPADNGPLPACPFFVKTTINLHTGQSKAPGVECTEITDVNEQCVNDLLRPGTPTGRWTPINQCNVVAANILNQCKTCTPRRPEWRPNNGDWMGMGPK